MYKDDHLYGVSQFTQIHDDESAPYSQKAVKGGAIDDKQSSYGSCLWEQDTILFDKRSASNILRIVGPQKMQMILEIFIDEVTRVLSLLSRPGNRFDQVTDAVCTTMSGAYMLGFKALAVACQKVYYRCESDVSDKYKVKYEIDLISIKNLCETAKIDAIILVSKLIRGNMHLD